MKQGSVKEKEKFSAENSPSFLSYYIHTFGYE
jgi:hypothetical protein